MTIPQTAADHAKFAAAKHASDQVEQGMCVGLGTGSTAAWLVRCLGDRVRDQGLQIKAVPTSSRTAQLAREVGIDVQTLEQVPHLDITIDGADEFDSALNLIKGGGGALLQEKVVAVASDKMIVITDATKQVDTLGAFSLPVEVLQFGWKTTQRLIESQLAASNMTDKKISRRMLDAAPYVTDEGNFILDLQLVQIPDAPKLALWLNQIPGVVENGLFIDICTQVLIGYADGTISIRDKTLG